MAFGLFICPLGSYINDRFSYRFTALLGSSFGIIGFLLASVSSRLWMMYPTFSFMSGCGYRAVYNSSMLVVLQYFVRRRSLAVGIITSAIAVGMLGITQFTQALLSAFSWRGTLRGFALLYVICGLCSFVFVPLDKALEKDAENLTTRPRQKETRCQPLHKNGFFIIFSISLIIVSLGYYVPTIHIIKHCQQELHISGEKSSMLFIYLAIASFFSRHIFCTLGDFRCFNRFHLYQVAMTISGLCVICLPLAKSFPSIAAIFIVFGLMEGAQMGQLTLLVLECVGNDKVNQAWGYLMPFLGLSIGIGPPLAGLMADRFGSYTASFYTAGAVVIVGASITSLMMFAKKQPENYDVKQSYDEEHLFVKGQLENFDAKQSYDEEFLVTEKVTVL